MAWYDWAFYPLYGMNKWLLQRLLPKRPAPPGMPGRPPQDAAYGRVLALIYGKGRFTPNLIYRSDWVNNGAPAVDLLLALCEGPIAGFGRVWWGKISRDAAVQVGFMSSPLLLGSRPTQSAAFFLPAGQDIGYPGIAMQYAHTFASIEDALGQLSFEVKGISHATGDATNGDAHPADILKGSVATPATSLLCNTDYGAGFPYTVETDVGRDGNAASSYRRYTAAEALWLSPGWTEQKAASQCLQDVLDATNATCLWTSGLLEIVPLGERSVTRDFITYTPETTIRYNLGPDDFVPRGDGSRIEVELAPEAETYNIQPVEFYDRAPAGVAADPGLAYQSAVVEDPDPVDAFSVGERRAPSISLHAIAQRSVALKMSRILAQRNIRTRNTYRGTLPWRFCRLQPLDFVTLSDDLLGLSLVPVRIESIREDAQRNFEIEAVDWPEGTSAVAEHQTQSSDGPAPALDDYDAEARLHQVAATSWSQRTGLPAACSRVASNGSRLVAVGASDACMYSDDHGETWTVGSLTGSGGVSTWNDVKWIPWLNLWVAVGVNAAASSADGITFTPRTIPAGTYNSIVDTGSAIAAVGASVAASSTTGTSWTTRTIPAGTYEAAAWSGLAVAAIGTSVVATSDATCVTWTARTAPSMQATAIEWTNEKFVAAGQEVSGNTIRTAIADADGITWTRSDSRGTETVALGGMAFSGRALCVLARSQTIPQGRARILTAKRDGLDWDAAWMSTVASVFGVTWSGRRWVACGASTSMWLSGMV